MLRSILLNQGILLGRLSDWWRHLRKYLGTNATNYFMYQWAGPVCFPLPLTLHVQAAPAWWSSRSHLWTGNRFCLNNGWIPGQNLKKPKFSRSSESKIWWFQPIPDLNRTKNHNKTQPSDFHQSSLRKKNKIPVKITLDTLNPSKYSRTWILIFL